MKTATTKRILWIASALAVLFVHVGAVRVGERSLAERTRRENQDLLGAVLGDARVILGRSLYRKADIAFHAGVAEAAKEHRQGDRPAIAAAGDADAEEHDHEHHHDGDHDHEACDHDACGHEHHHHEHAAGIPRWVAWIDDGVHPRTHRHLKGTQAQEILPWLALAIQADPHAAEPYLVAGYWLGWVFDRTKEAEQILQAGLQRAEPKEPLERELGRLYFRRMNDPARGRPHLERALALWEERNAAGEEPDLHDKGETLFYLGECLAGLGERDEAVRVFQELLAIWPDKPGLREHIRALASS